MSCFGKSAGTAMLVASFGLPLPAAAQSTAPANPTADITAIVQRAVAPCWSAPAAGDGAPVVVFSIRLTPQGELDGEPRLVSPDPAGDAAILAASARRAILRCAPFSALVPYRQRYDLWKVIDLRFDPRGP